MPTAVSANATIVANTAYNNVTAQLNYAKAQGTNGIVMFDYGTLYNSSGTLATAQAEVRRAFTDFYAAASVCTPSRAAMLCGCYPPRIGMGEFRCCPAASRGRRACSDGGRHMA